MRPSPHRAPPSSRARLHALRLWLAIALAPACALPPPLDGRSAYATNQAPLEVAWAEEALRVPDKAFMVIEGAGKLPPRVRGDSSYWAERFLAPAVRPFDQAPAGLVLSIHARSNTSPDLLRYQYRALDLEISVVESASYALVRIGAPGRRLPGALDAAQVNRVAALVLHHPGAAGEGHFVALPSIAGEARFSTASSTDPATMPSWEGRADAGSSKGQLYFFLYKKNPARYGYDNPQSWFDEEFRKIFRLW